MELLEQLRGMVKAAAVLRPKTPTADRGLQSLPDKAKVKEATQKAPDRPLTGPT